MGIDFDIFHWMNSHALVEKIHEQYKADRKLHEIYCHYTSPSAILSIFSDYIKESQGDAVKQCTLRASNIRFLNDYMEYLEGIEILESLRAKKSNNKSSYGENGQRQRTVGEQETAKSSDSRISENIYSISFCGDSDLLSQWKWYGKESGVAIVFNMENIQYNYWSLDDDKSQAIPLDSPLRNDRGTKPLPVCYDIKKQTSFFRTIQKVGKKPSPTQWPNAILDAVFVSFCKNVKFSEEQESRLIFFTCPPQKGIKRFNTAYYVSNGIIKPSLDVVFQYKNNTKIESQTDNQNIIKEIVVGPGQDQNLVYNAMIHIFDSNTFSFHETDNIHTCANGVNIKKSAIPFRG